MTNPNQKIVLGLVGPMASGKGTACQYLESKYGAGSLRFSTILRDILDRLHIEHSRGNLQTLSSTLRGAFGDDIMALTMLKDVEADSRQIIVIDGVRRLPDIKYLAELPNFHLVSIDADIKARHQRITQRTENPDDQGKTFEQFVLDNQGEAELQIKEVQDKATLAIDNNGSMADLERQLDEIIVKFRS